MRREFALVSSRADYQVDRVVHRDRKIMAIKGPTLQLSFSYPQENANLLLTRIESHYEGTLMEETRLISYKEEDRAKFLRLVGARLKVVYIICLEAVRLEWVVAVVELMARLEKAFSTDAEDTQLRVVSLLKLPHQQVRLFLC
ncbi:uncharacterized protein G2W53_013822 [Senna tora]|uniref:Uncharacterized protein n=1 Tax=Senna tora TaxID=362788 RepID=A0A834U0C4_9FABA|nr:uncharacterized protein G2W53_013822 [Senna tora]